MDYGLEQALNGPAGHHAFLDALMRDAATWAVPVFIAVVAAWFAVGWVRGPREERRGALTALLAAGGALAVNQGVLLLWSRDRPFAAHPGAVHTLVARSADPSFPSDHATASVAIATVLLLAHRRLGLVALAGAALVCVSRVYVGAHYPGDVLAGAAIGAGVAWVAHGPLAGPIGRVADLMDAVLRRLRIPPRDQALSA